MKQRKHTRISKLGKMFVAGSQPDTKKFKVKNHVSAVGGSRLRKKLADMVAKDAAFQKALGVDNRVMAEDRRDAMKRMGLRWNPLLRTWTK